MIFSVFFGSDFFLNGFLQSIHGSFRHSFLLELNLSFSLAVFLHMQLSEFDFQFFLNFYLNFLGNGFPNSLIVRSRSSFYLVNENSLNCTSRLVLLCFF